MIDTHAPGIRTKFANKNCYARALNDCAHDDTREHYISKTLLDRAGSFVVDGFAWLPSPKTLTSAALRSAILCKRHNNALSGLDENIVHLYDFLRRWQDRREVGSLVLDGEDLERWAVKVMFGMFASGSARPEGEEGSSRGPVPAIPLRHLRILFGETQFEPPAGFYFAHEIFEELTPTTIRSRVHWTESKPAPDTIAFSLVGFTWLTTLSTRVDVPLERYRPSDFTIGGVGALTLRWNGQRRTHATIALSEIRGSTSH